MQSAYSSASADWAIKQMIIIKLEVIRNVTVAYELLVFDRNDIIAYKLWYQEKFLGSWTIYK